MARQKNDQTPLGELLTKARLDKHMSRAKLAKETGISENSLVRYEKAGLEKDGQYPPSPKLARLCFTLDIPPLTAMFSSLSRDEFWEFKGYTARHWLMDHPDYEYLMDQWFTLNKENHKLAALLKLLLGPKPATGSNEEEMLDWLKSEACRIIKLQDAFDKRLEDRGLLDLAKDMVSIPGHPDHKINEGKASLFDYSEFVKNGPDQNDPSRSMKPKNNAKAVEAASTKPTKGKTDEAV